MFSQRALERPVWHAAQYEFEDLPLGLDDVDLLAPPRQPHPGASRESRRVVNGLLKRAGVPRRTPPWNRPSMSPTRVEADHDLFFAVLYSGYQIAHLHRLRGWRERSRHTACLLVEMWGRNVGINEDYLRLLADFDVVYVMNPAILPRLAQLGVTCTTFMPVGVDTVAFSPLPHLPPRSIDLLGYGHTSPVVHRRSNADKHIMSLRVLGALGGSVAEEPVGQPLAGATLDQVGRWRGSGPSGASRSSAGSGT